VSGRLCRPEPDRWRLSQLSISIERPSSSWAFGRVTVSTPPSRAASTAASSTGSGRRPDWETLSREDSICTYAMLEDDVTVIEDVQADPRFEHNETLKALGIRSYAGAKIEAPNGQVIGQLCVTNEQPRSYTEAERADLALFADEVAEQLELRRRLSAQGTTEEDQL